MRADARDRSRRGGMLLSAKATEPLIRSFRHDCRLVLGEFCDGSLAHVQVLGNHRRRRTGNPIGQGDICEIGTSEHFEELQVGVACVLEIVPEVLLGVPDGARVEVHCDGVRASVEDRHLPFALDPVLPFIGVGVPVHLPQAAGMHRYQRGGDGCGNGEVAAVGDPYRTALRRARRGSRSEREGEGVRIADSRNFTVSTTVAAALVTVHPGGLREMHWHPNADEWQYWIKGKGQMTVFNTGPNAVTMDFNAGDVGYVKKNLGHYIKNTGDTDLQFLEVFRSSYFADVSLSDWISRTPPAMVAQHLNVSEATIAKFPKDKPAVMPE